MEIPIEAESPKHAVMSPDSQWIYISAEDSDKVDGIDVQLPQ
jgi:hypothetical protein